MGTMLGIESGSCSRRRPRHVALFCEEVVERADRRELVVLNVEHSVELGNVEDVMNFLGEVEKLELASGVPDGGKAALEFSNARAVDVIDADQVEDDLLLAFCDEVADGTAQLADFVAEDNSAMDVEDGNVSDFACSNLQRHGSARSQGRWREW